MKSTYLFYGLFLIITLQACSSTKSTTKDSLEIYWVAGAKSVCEGGAGEQLCLLIKREDNFENGNWENFYSAIEGFEFKEGIAQKIEISKQTLNANSAAQDVSKINYKQIKVIETKTDTISLLHHSWTLARINKNPINRKTPLPNLTIDAYKLNASGNDGCNTYNGTITILNSHSIVFSQILRTEKYCLVKVIADEYYYAMENVKSFKVTAKELTFFDEAGQEILFFIRKAELK